MMLIAAIMNNKPRVPISVEYLAAIRSSASGERSAQNTIITTGLAIVSRPVKGNLSETEGRDFSVGDMANRYFVYIMSSQSRTLYVGMTNDLQRRVVEHKRHAIGGFTDRYNVTQLVHFEETLDMHVALV